MFSSRLLDVKISFVAQVKSTEIDFMLIFPQSFLISAAIQWRMHLMTNRYVLDISHVPLQLWAHGRYPIDCSIGRICVATCTLDPSARMRISIFEIGPASTIVDFLFLQLYDHLGEITFGRSLSRAFQVRLRQ